MTFFIALSGEDETRELSGKDSKDTKNKKDEKVDKKTKGLDKNDSKKDKSAPQSALKTERIKNPEIVIFASFSNPPSYPCKVSDLKEFANSSEKLRQFGLSHTLPHPVNVSVVRNCPLIPPPTPVPIPRWKLIRQKKKREIVEPPFHPPVEPKEPKFLELKSPFFNYKVSPIPLTGRM